MIWGDNYTLEDAWFLHALLCVYSFCVLTHYLPLLCILYSLLLKKRELSSWLKVCCFRFRWVNKSHYCSGGLRATWDTFPSFLVKFPSILVYHTILAVVCVQCIKFGSLITNWWSKWQVSFCDLLRGALAVCSIVARGNPLVEVRVRMLMFRRHGSGYGSS